jgi:hypothetical protein
MDGQPQISVCRFLNCTRCDKSDIMRLILLNDIGQWEFFTLLLSEECAHSGK